MFSPALLKQATRLLKTCEERGLMIATAESCTGGLIAALMTEIPGSSSVMERGFITYSNAAKHSLLGVSAASIQRYGAVSEQVAKAMAEGALKNSNAQLSIAVTGIAGPAGGSKSKPVGLVYIACDFKRHGTVIEMHQFRGKRSAIRLAAVKAALTLLTACLARYA